MTEEELSNIVKPPPRWAKSVDGRALVTVCGFCQLPYRQGWAHTPDYCWDIFSCRAAVTKPEPLREGGIENGTIPASK